MIISSTLRFLTLRLPLLALPVILMGAEGQCDPPPDDACPDIALDCSEDETAEDTNGDGCLDSCVPVATCLAFPVCEEGDVQLDDAGACPQDDGNCYEVSICNASIWCTTPDTTTSCWSDDECGGDEFCDVINFCDAAEARPDCADGSNCAPPVCYGRCMPRLDQCEAYPVCNDGDFEVDGPGGCLQDDAVCYDATICGYTIWCTGPSDAPPSCLENADCGDGQICDLENFCEDSGDCAEGDVSCLTVCYGLCIEDTIACPAVQIECEEGYVPVDSDGDGCLDSCDIDGCLELPAIQCDEGFTPIDADGDGCLDTCAHAACTEIAIDCEEGYEAIDSNGDGCLDSCAARGV